MTHTLIEDIQHGVILIESNLQTGISTEGDISKNNTQTDGHQQKRLEIFLDGKIDKDSSHYYHNQVTHRGIGKACIGEKLVEIVDDKLEHNYQFIIHNS